jgi:hypothetical protein
MLVGGGNHYPPAGTDQYKKRQRLGGRKSLKALRLAMQTIEYAKLIHTKIYNTNIRRYGKNAYSSFKGKKHTEETKKKMSKAHKWRSRGKGNSQYGTCWVYSLVLKQNKKIRRIRSIFRRRMD